MMKPFVSIGLTLLIAGASFGAETGDGGGNVFAGTLAQSIAAAIVFVILLTVLWRFAWGPILKGLQDRENRIKSDLEHAEAAAKNAQETLAEYKKQLAAAQAEAGRIIEQGRTDAQRVAANLKQQTQTEIDQMRQRAQDDIRAAKEHAIGEIHTQAAVLATGVASKILHREINPGDHQKLIRESLDALAKAQS